MYLLKQRRLEELVIGFGRLLKLVMLLQVESSVVQRKGLCFLQDMMTELIRGIGADECIITEITIKINGLT